MNGKTPPDKSNRWAFVWSSCELESCSTEKVGLLRKWFRYSRLDWLEDWGNGKQFFPWIHSNDLVQLIRWAATNESVEGVFNATAETPVTNADFTRYLAKILRRPAFLPAPRFGLRLMLGEFADSLLVSHRAVPQAALKAGFEFQYKDIGSALTDLLA